MRYTIHGQQGADWAGMGERLGAALMRLFDEDAYSGARREGMMDGAKLELLRQQAAAQGEQARGLRMTNDYRMAPVAPDASASERAMRQLFAMTGDTNAYNLARAQDVFHRSGLRDEAAQLARTGDVAGMNRMNTLTADGGTYEPFRPIGNTGHALDVATGKATQASDVLSRLFSEESAARTRQHDEAAKASSARAYASTQAGDIDAARLDRFLKTGRLGDPAADGASDGGVIPGKAVKQFFQTYVGKDLDDRPIYTDDTEGLLDFILWAQTQGLPSNAETTWLRWINSGKPTAREGAQAAAAALLPARPTAAPPAAPAAQLPVFPY